MIHAFVYFLQILAFILGVVVSTCGGIWLILALLSGLMDWFL